jgi:hypothetical protein
MCLHGNVRGIHVLVEIPVEALDVAAIFADYFIGLSESDFSSSVSHCFSPFAHRQDQAPYAHTPSTSSALQVLAP